MAPHLLTDELNGHERESSRDPSLTGMLPVSSKNRTSPFMRRTRTGCMTCRNRKKKCDEAKPECMTSLMVPNRKDNLNNLIQELGKHCTRGGFTCEGYAKKTLLPMNSTTIHLSPPQVQKPLAHGLVAAYPRSSGFNRLYTSCCEPARSNSQRVEGARAQSKPDGEKEHEAFAPATLCNGGNGLLRVSHLEHASPLPTQDFRPSVTSYDKIRSRDRDLPPQVPSTVSTVRLIYSLS
jgi:hypothetical protein